MNDKLTIEIDGVQYVRSDASIEMVNHLLDIVHHLGGHAMHLAELYINEVDLLEKMKNAMRGEDER